LGPPLFSVANGRVLSDDNFVFFNTCAASTVRNAFIRIVNQAGGAEIARYDLSEEASTETAMVFGELYRHVRPGRAVSAVAALGGDQRSRPGGDPLTPRGSAGPPARSATSRGNSEPDTGPVRGASASRVAPDSPAAPATRIIPGG
jgi:hypothetical protein